MLARPICTQRGKRGLEQVEEECDSQGEDEEESEFDIPGFDEEEPESASAPEREPESEFGAAAGGSQSRAKRKGAADEVGSQTRLFSRWHALTHVGS